MQYYTKQQLQGAARYTGKCRVGNWNEDVEQEEVLLKDYLAKKDMGTLKLDKFHSRMATALAPAMLTAAGENVTFGALMQLKAFEGAVLSCDVEDKDPRAGENCCAVTASKVEAPCARNTFSLVKSVPTKNNAFDLVFDDDVLHYGQKFKIVANSAVGGEPMYLRSMPVSTTHFAKFSRHQAVSLCPKEEFNTVWTVLTPDPAQRLVSEGVPVMGGAPVLIQHCATKQNLCCEPVPYVNDFGSEAEVSAHTVTSLRAAYAAVSMQDGTPLNLAEKVAGSENIFTFVTG